MNDTTILSDIQVSKETGKVRIDIKTGEIKKNNWKNKKLKSIELSESYERLSIENDYYIKKAEKVKKCGDYLEFKECSNGHKQLSSAYFCKDRLCPMCSWRRSKMMQKQIHDILAVSIVRQPKMRYLFLTLTIKNCDPEEVSKEITRLMNGFNRLFKYKKVAKNLIGYFRTLEITKNNDKDSESFGTYHPHFHVLLGVNNNYFNRVENYIKTSEWSKLWKKALKIDYQPIVDVRAVKPKETTARTTEGGKMENRPTDIDYIGAVLETAKYTVKDSDYLLKNETETDETIKTLSLALKGRRLFGVSGLFKEIKKELGLQDIESDNADLVGLENEICTCPICSGEMMKTIYNWRMGFVNGKKDFNYFRR